MHTKSIALVQLLRARNLCTATLTALVLATSFEVGIKPSFAGTIRHDRDDWSYRNLADNFPSVGYLAFNNSFNNSYQSWGCSGTLIGSSYVLTAAHCVANPTKGWLDYATFFVGGGAYYSDAAYVSGSWFDYDLNLGLGLDMAVMRLSRDVWNVDPAILYSGRDEDLKLGTYVGYGQTGDGITGAYSFDYLKRAGQNTIGLGNRLGVSDDILVSDFDDPRDTNSSGVFAAQDLEYQLGLGDSGGGLFIDGRLAGIHSYMSSDDGNTDADYGDVSASVRVSSRLDWILATANALARVGGMPTPSIQDSPGVTSDGRGWDRQAEAPLAEKYNQFDYTTRVKILTDEEFKRYSSESTQDDEPPVSTPEPGGLMGLMGIVLMALVGRKSLGKQEKKF